MQLERHENNSIVSYKRNGEIVGLIYYNHTAPSEDALRILARLISQLYKESLKAGSN